MLTAKQEKFAISFVRTGVATTAYLEAYEVNADTPRKTVWEMSSRVLNNRKVAARILDIRRQAAEELQLTIRDLALEFTQNRYHALDRGRVSAANTATAGKAKLFGFL